MHFEVNTTDARPIYRQIVDEVHRGIATGVLRAGEALPPLRQLAKDLGINPNTVQHAYRALEQEGLVVVHRGRGTFVATPRGSRVRPGQLARQVAERALRGAYRHGLVASDLVAAITDIAPKVPDR